MKNIFLHTRTILRHRHEVIKNCKRAGILGQGLVHDLSKFSPTEFIPGVKYYMGSRSPNVKEREVKGYSAAWLHHKGRNRHHFEYWTDYSPEKRTIVPVEMPKRYFAEMICDRIAASKTYKGTDYTDSSPYEYFKQGTDTTKMHPNTAWALEHYLKLLADEGEDVMFNELRKYASGQ